MTTNRPLRVFLCHSSNDKPSVRELYQKLRAEPWIEPWLAFGAKKNFTQSSGTFDTSSSRKYDTCITKELAV